MFTHDSKGCIYDVLGCFRNVFRMLCRRGPGLNSYTPSYFCIVYCTFSVSPLTFIFALLQLRSTVCYEISSTDSKKAIICNCRTFYFLDQDHFRLLLQSQFLPMLYCPIIHAITVTVRVMTGTDIWDYRGEEILSAAYILYTSDFPLSHRKMKDLGNLTVDKMEGNFNQEDT